MSDRIGRNVGKWETEEMVLCDSVCLNLGGGNFFDCSRYYKLEVADYVDYFSGIICRICRVNGNSCEMRYKENQLRRSNGTS